MIKAIAIDDEPLALDVIVNHTSQLAMIDLIATFTNPLEAFGYLAQNQVDLIFLDVQMPELSGINFIKSSAHPPKIVLTTAYPDYALEGYELSVTDYLLKPISFDRFLKSVLKIEQLVNAETPKQSTQTPAKEEEEHDFIFVNTDYKSLKVPFKDILYVEGWKDYVKIHLDDEEILTLLSIKQLEAILPKKQFVRIHKSFIVAYAAIESVERNQIKIKSNLLNIGGSYKDSFNTWLEKFKVN